MTNTVEYSSIEELILPFYIPALLSQICRALVVTVLPLHALSLGLGYGQVGMITTIAAVGAVAVNFPAASFVSERGPKAGFLLSCLLFVVAAALAAVLPSSLNEHVGPPAAQVTGKSLLLFAASSSILAAADSMCELTRETFMSATSVASARGKIASLHGGLSRASFTIGPLVGGFVAYNFGPRFVYLVLAFTASSAAAAVALWMPYIRADQDISSSSLGRSYGATPPPCKPPPSSMQIWQEHWHILTICSIFCGCLMVQKQARMLLLPLEGYALNLSQKDAGAITSMSFFVDASLFPVAGYLLDTIGRRRTGILTFLIGAFSIVVLILSRRSFGWEAYLDGFVAFALIGGIANGISTGIVSALSSDIAPSEGRSTFLAIFRTLRRSPEMIAPAFLGLLAQSLSLDAAEFAMCAVSVCGALWGLCMFPDTLFIKKDILP